MKDKEKVELLREGLNLARKEILNGAPNYSFVDIIEKINKILEDTK